MDLCRRIATEAVLHEHGIKSDEFTSVTHQPATLICQLYEYYGVKAEIRNGNVVGIPSKQHPDLFFLIVHAKKS